MGVNIRTARTSKVLPTNVDFINGRQFFMDKAKERSSRPLASVIDDCIASVDKRIRGNRQMNLPDITQGLGISYWSANDIVKEKSLYRNVSTRWAYKELTY